MIEEINDFIRHKINTSIYEVWNINRNYSEDEIRIVIDNSIKASITNIVIFAFRNNVKKLLK